jgi:molybdopterin converting factor subunit 1
MRILFFAHLTQATHCREVEMTITDLDMEGFWQIVTAKFPELATFRSSVRLARNGEYVGREAGFTDGDEVALIPPVSGG